MLFSLTEVGPCCCGQGKAVETLLCQSLVGDILLGALLPRAWYHRKTLLLIKNMWHYSSFY